MSRGFSLLEVVISFGVLSLVLTLATPSFINLTINSQMTRAANELHGFLNQARSEAVWRNRDLWAHFSFASHPASAKEWALTLTDSQLPNQGNKLLVLQGKSFKNLQLDWSYSANKIKFDGIRGRVKDGSLNFYSPDQADNALRLKSSYAANRVIICGVKRSSYGFPKC